MAQPSGLLLVQATGRFLSSGEERVQLMRNSTVATKLNDGIYRVLGKIDAPTQYINMMRRRDLQFPVWVRTRRNP